MSWRLNCGAFRRRPIAHSLPLVVAILLAMVFCESSARAADIRVMSFNVRFSKVGSNEKASENNWADPQHPRRERAIRVIHEANPDLLGVQEARDLQVNDFKAALPEYEFYGIGRDDGKTAGEYSGIFYRKDRFTREDSGSFWLSATPDTPGTTFSYNKLPRIASWVKLKDNKSNREFMFLNMHWDHQDASAREKTATLVRERLTTIGKDTPAIVTGDLNSKEDTKAFATLTGEDASGRKLADSYRETHSAAIARGSELRRLEGHPQRFADRFHSAHRRIHSERRRNSADELRRLLAQRSLSGNGSSANRRQVVALPAVVYFGPDVRVVNLPHGVHRLFRDRGQIRGGTVIFRLLRPLRAGDCARDSFVHENPAQRKLGHRPSGWTNRL